MSTRSGRESAIQILRSADAVCLDVDSTVVPYEGIDMLARQCGVGEQVAAYTKQAMEGGVPFEVALAERLKLMKPSLSAVEACVKEHGTTLTPGIAEFVQLLHSRNVPVFLISGGFRQMIAPIAARLGIPASRIFANRLLFDDSGAYAGFDEKEPTSRSGGKRVVIERLMSKYGYKRVVMIGDGATDLETRPPAALFIGFGGVVTREKVRQGADLFVTDFGELIRVMADPPAPASRDSSLPLCGNCEAVPVSVQCQLCAHPLTYVCYECFLEIHRPAKFHSHTALKLSESAVANVAEKIEKQRALEEAKRKPGHCQQCGVRPINGPAQSQLLQCETCLTVLCPACDERAHRGQATHIRVWLTDEELPPCVLERFDFPRPAQPDR